MMAKSVVGNFKNLLESDRMSNLLPKILKISRRSIGGQNLLLEIFLYRATLSTVANRILGTARFTIFKFMVILVPIVSRSTIEC